MARRSARAGKSSNFQLARPSSNGKAVDLQRRDTSSSNDGVSISLKFYRSETECFSEWRPDDLKKFSGTIAKIKQMSVNDLRFASRLCSPHRGDPKAERFARPAGLSPDLSMFEIRVDRGNAARIHGVFIGSVFHLVWLDRYHEVFPQRPRG